MNPYISIGMPFYNCEQTLPSAICSILLQTYQDWELILIDDGSTDNSLQIAQTFTVTDPRIRLIVGKQNQGLSYRLNQAIHQSHGQFFARIDGDDIAYPQRFEKQVDYLESHPHVDLVGAQVLIFDQNGIALGIHRFPESHDEILRHPFSGFLPMNHSSFMGHLTWFRKYLYNERAINFQDQVLLLDSYRTSVFANIPCVLMGYYIGQLKPKKLLQARYYKILFLFRQVLLQDCVTKIPVIVMQQLSKALIEIIAISTGLHYYLLGHRAGQPIEPFEQAEWLEVWKLVHQEDKR